MENLGSLIILIISCILLLWLSKSLNIKKAKNHQVKEIFFIMLIMMILWTLSLILQILFQKSRIAPFEFEKIAAFGACFVPVTFMLFGISFAKTKIKVGPLTSLLYVIPVISTILMFTNGHHHLMYKQYLISVTNTVFGAYFPIHSIYSYTCIFIGLLYLIIYNIRNSGFFSKQSLLIFAGVLISVSINVLATFGILNLTVYATPLSFTIAFMMFALAIFKFDFLKVAPIALQRVVDRMSDGYIIVNDEQTITDFNRTFLDLFSLKASEVRNININNLISKLSNSQDKNRAFLEAINQTKSNDKTIRIERYFSQLNKYFNIEINSIKNKNTYLGTLILFKDITQHTMDMKTIKDNQDMLIEKERLASLGQMIGGIAHNLKTPIMSIAGAAEGLSDLIKEYDSSIEDPEVNAQDHHEIASDMSVWIEKIRTHLSYMSDVITAIKGQAVNFADQTSTSFTVKELMNYVDILMKHELKNALINLKSQADIDVGTEVKGNINSLVQVINNIISNAIQAYQSQGETNKDIDFRVYKEGSNIIFKIQDYAGGLPQNVQEKLFKEMITTKGKNGTGLGLFMSYSNIKAHFSGNLRYETSSEGTSFFIEIPM